VNADPMNRARQQLLRRLRRVPSAVAIGGIALLVILSMSVIGLARQRQSPPGFTASTQPTTSTGPAESTGSTSTTGPSKPSRSAGASSKQATPTGESTEQADPAAACRERHSAVVVRSAKQLQQALDTAKPGLLIRLADGIYPGEFVIKRSGKPGRRITACGSRRAVLRGPSLDEGYVLHLDGASHWTLSGFSVSNGQKGVVTDRASSNVLHDLAVHGTGHEAIHLRSFSSDNVVQRNEVRETGLRTEKFGEGIYVGSAHTNWCRYSDCRPDASDRNRILENRIGPNVAAESVDLKEGTSEGVVRGNTFLGENMTAADSWVDVKGNRYTIKGNRGILTPKDGFQVHVEATGWGQGNVFSNNVADLRGGERGIYIDKDASGNIVRCDNRVIGAREEASNVDCD
jgi:hypothetical protein